MWSRTRLFRFGWQLILILWLPQLLSANLVTLNFESFVDGDVITNQIPGLTFTHTVVATAAISLNEMDFPPHSGSNVVFDNGGPIT